MKVLGFFAMALAEPASALDEEKQVLATQKARRALAIALTEMVRDQEITQARGSRSRAG